VCEVAFSLFSQKSRKRVKEDDEEGGGEKGRVKRERESQ
jgi:hypothetical protein